MKKNYKFLIKIRKSYVENCLEDANEKYHRNCYNSKGEMVRFKSEAYRIKCVKETVKWLNEEISYRTLDIMQEYC